MDSHYYCGNSSNCSTIITIEERVTPTFQQLGPYCIGVVPAELPIISLNNITGTWNPEIIITTNSGSTVYTFTPAIGLCATATQMTIVVNNLPVVTVNSPAVCEGTPATLTATPETPGTYNYVWTVPAGAADPGSVASFDTEVAGIYSVVISDPATSCESEPAQGTVTINTVPVVTVNSPAVCEGTPATLTATPETPGTYNYVWTVPAGAADPGSVASFDTEVAGIYSVVISDPATSCESEPAQGTVTINTVPVVTVNSPAVCEGTPATLTATPETPGTYNYVWTVPAGAADPGSVASFDTEVAGIYSVVISDPATSCESEPAQGTVTINTVPVVTVNSPAVCEGTPATLTATPETPGTYNYVWTVPAGAADPGSVASFDTEVAGIYSVVISDPATSCESEPAQGTVTINTVPVVTVNSPAVCEGTPATLTATPETPGTYNYVWTVPAGAADPGSVASFDTEVAGIYSVVISDPATSCESEPAQGTVTINTVPVVTVNSPAVCEGTPATLTATPETPGTYNYVWTVPAGAADPGSVASFDTEVAGIYSVVISDPATSCESEPAQGTVTINTVPVVTVNSPAVCEGTPATLTATPETPGTYNYVWTVPAGAADPGSVASFDTEVAGIYSVVISDPATSCESEPAQGTVTINTVPVVTVNSPAVCEGTPATLTATPETPGTYNYVWTVPAGAADPGSVASFDTEVAGIYSVVISDPATSCESEPAQGTVTINTVPVVTVNSPAVCEGTPATLTATPETPGTYNYVWTVPAGAADPGSVASFDTEVAGIYSVVISDPATSCESEPAQGTVTINTVPVVTVNSPAVCEGTPATLTATPETPGTYNYVWTVPAGAADPGSVASFDTEVAGIYSVVISDPATSCESEPAQGTVTINTVPTLSATAPAISCNTGTTTITVTATGGTEQYQYSLDGVTFQDDNTFTDQAAGNYTITVRDANGCTATLTYQVQNVCIELEKTGTFVDVNNDGVQNAGDQISYNFIITNTGNVPLTNITVTDPSISVSGGPLASLEPNTSDNSTFTGVYTLTQADINAGAFTNTATVTGTTPSGESVEDTDDFTLQLTRTPQITLEKTGTYVDDPPRNRFNVGDQITYSFTVTNTGNVPLVNVTVTDPLIIVTGGPLASLDPGATDATTFTGTYTLTQTDIDAGTFTNIAEASGTFDNIDYIDEDNDVQTITTEPAIELIKTGTYIDSNGDDIYNAGDQISYEFSVTNTGNVTLVNVRVSDPIITVNGGPIPTLNPGETDNTAYTGTYTLTQADIDAGTFTNTATATGRFRDEEYSGTDDDIQNFTSAPGCIVY